VSFLVAWGSLSLLCATAAILHRPALRGGWMAEVLVPFGCIGAVFGFGMLRMMHSPETARQVRLALIQPSIPQTLIWDPANNSARFQDLLRLSEEALSNKVDVLIWPEAAIPNLLRYDLATFVAITNLALEHHVWMIVGSDDAVHPEHSANPQDADFYNSSFLISPEGRLAEGYRKRKLVIFGEYLPLERSLPFLKWFTPVQSSFRSGIRAIPFDMPSLDLRTSVLICYEDGFPRLGRDCALLDPDFLVNITNDGWFGEGAAQWQQAASSRFRTVENNLPLVRCTNTGLTCWYDACGRLRDLFKDKGGTIYGPGYLLTTLELPAKGERAATFYDRHGDWFGWGCAGLAGLMALPISIRKQEPKSVLH
jgi:apolipoprotein N-acyltransferase